MKVSSIDKRKKRIRSKLSGTSAKPRLSVFRSNKHIYVQAIDDILGRTLFSCSTFLLRDKNSKTEKAQIVGASIAKSLMNFNIFSVVFDRNGCLYHGRIKALADAARQQGLNF